MEELSCCVLIPTYNNEKTLAAVIQDVSLYTSNIIVINDGSTDSTEAILEEFSEIENISYSPNKGKGFALKTGLLRAKERGFKYAISIDSDGQHFADDIPRFLEAIEEHPNAMLVGARNLQEENMPQKNTFGNKFSNFWFNLETGIDLPDTQSGFRLYPLKELEGMKLFTTKYEFEIEIMVKMAWKKVPVLPVPIKVFYAKGDERVSHFRPFKDFFRISVLNTYLVTLAFLWYIPVRFFKNLNRETISKFIKESLLNREESASRKAFSVAFGVFMGIIPIWGYQLMTAIFLSHLLKLNKAIVIIAANISFPPFIPFILLGSLKIGQILLNQNASVFPTELSLEVVKQQLPAYILGSFVFAGVMAILLGTVTFISVKVNRAIKS
ncbi:DUF2062 domain-containing protein [Arcticibacterium luteifluviistationis]|uniref:DUF2062 domain-containing protein n=2 Tax=Arcticibacterium luteifluviistationis TaxID=1784714 RepID=A0A2Z4GCY6_9BACT|nr:DUF2062 domain-containing protein [Arcticibacterium luteifluviistationis]